ncbi:hypothetical protein [Geodermatophilus maliterrae]|uniref:PEP-CTERM protein-sorting domain-containing protein n=1 Tax=Geodermatophilus maliterrae TaxID=3162531 RepID=A0ABV3XG69_9ACTN
MRQRWARVGAAAAALSIGIGALVTLDLRDQLSDDEALLTLAGSAVEVVGLVGALACCGLVLREAFRTRRAAGPRDAR